MKKRCILASTIFSILCGAVYAYEQIPVDPRLPAVIAQASESVFFCFDENDMSVLDASVDALIAAKEAGRRVSIIVTLSNNDDHSSFKAESLSRCAGVDIPIQATLSRVYAFDKLMILDNRYVIHGAQVNSGPDAFGEITLIDAPELAAHYLSQIVSSMKDLIDVTVIKEDAAGRPIDPDPVRTKTERIKAESDRRVKHFFDDRYVFPVNFFEKRLGMLIKQKDWAALNAEIEAVTSDHDTIDSDSAVIVPAAEVTIPVKNIHDARTLFAVGVISAYADKGKYFPEVSSNEVKQRFGISKNTVLSWRENSR